MEFIKNILFWINGKKTIIGLIALNILQIDGLFDSEQSWYKICIYLFGLLAAGGLTHKAVKKAKK